MLPRKGTPQCEMQKRHPLRMKKAPKPSQDKADDPQDQLVQLKAELSKYKDVALRSVADLDNYRKRMAREKDDAIRYANTSFLERLIPILDNFELGLQAAKAGGSQSAVQDGMMMVFRQLQDFLASCGVETVDATGQHFDPNVHEAIAQELERRSARGHRHPATAKRLQIERSIDSPRERGGLKGSAGRRGCCNARCRDITNGYEKRLLRSFGSGAERQRRRYQEVVSQTCG